eukprot:1557086-Alexandrium_andersonii.AAC.1
MGHRPNVHSLWRAHQLATLAAPRRAASAGGALTSKLGPAPSAFAGVGIPLLDDFELPGHKL